MKSLNAATVLILGTATVAQANNAQDARKLADTARRVSAQITGILQISDPQGDNESDSRVRSRLVASQNHLREVVANALQAEDLFAMGRFNEGINRFSFACSKSANTVVRLNGALKWARTPPRGAFARKTNELQNLKIDMEDIIMDVDCP